MTAAEYHAAHTPMSNMAKTNETHHSIQEAPRYTASEAAHYLRVPVSTVRAWAFGQTYESKDGTKHFRSVIELADREGKKLSFINLVELFVLAAIRRRHGVALKQVRRALDYLKRKFPRTHPLADNKIETDGIDLFVEKFGEYLAISKEGQLVIRELIAQRLRCVMRDENGNPLKLVLISRPSKFGTQGVVVIDPRLGFGRPVIDGTGIRTEVIVDRFRAGEKIESIADDYSRPAADIEEIVRAEMPLAA